MTNHSNDIEVYKFFTLLVSLIQVDFVLNIFFLQTTYYFTSISTGEKWYDLVMQSIFYSIAFFFLTLATMVYGITAIKNKDQHA